MSQPGGLPIIHTVRTTTQTGCITSGVFRISFRGGGFNFLGEKWVYLHGTKRHTKRGFATRFLWGFGGMFPQENFKKWCKLVRFREYFAKILSQKNCKKIVIFYIKVIDKVKLLKLLKLLSNYGQIALSLGVLEHIPQISCHFKLCVLVCFGVHFP